jgi:DNA-binding SARP family transcriptional activator
LLVTFRWQMLEREQITEMLWPELDPDDAQRDFKVAYSVLRRVLEPERARNAPSAFLIRDGSLYGLRPGADLWIDVDQFDALVAKGDRQFDQNVVEAMPHYRAALALYKGEFLQENPYEEWCSVERERLHTSYLKTADRLARTLAAQNAWEETIEVCQAILSHDDCWEQAYRLMMEAYAHLGNRAQALRTYHRCAERLQKELGVEPVGSTSRLYESILSTTPDEEINP